MRFHHLVAKTFILTVGFSTGCKVLADNIDFNLLEAFARRIDNSLPASWHIAEKKTGLIPAGHYDGLEYKGPTGGSLILTGQNKVNYNWKDKDGAWHEDPVLVEAVQLWLMPPDYRLSWKRFFVMKKQMPAEEICSGDKVKIYGQEGVHKLPEFQTYFAEIEARIAATQGTPDHTVSSWKTWKQDITKACDLF